MEKMDKSEESMFWIGMSVEKMDNQHLFIFSA